MSCFYNVAKKINIFNRDNSEITKADTYSTYLFLLSSLGILVWYSYKYWELSKSYYETCEETDTSIDCVRADISHLVVPYVGILYGFFGCFYQVFNISSLCFNYIFCCYFCCSQKVNINIIENNTPTGKNTTIEINKIVDI